MHRPVPGPLSLVRKMAGIAELWTAGSYWSESDKGSNILGQNLWRLIQDIERSLIKIIKSIKNYRSIWYSSFCALLTHSIIAEKWKRKRYVLPLRAIIWLQEDSFRSIEYFKPYILMCVSLTLGWEWKEVSFMFFFILFHFIIKQWCQAVHQDCC